MSFTSGNGTPKSIPCPGDLGDLIFRPTFTPTNWIPRGRNALLHPDKPRPRLLDDGAGRVERRPASIPLFSTEIAQRPVERADVLEPQVADDHPRSPARQPGPTAAQAAKRQHRAAARRKAIGRSSVGSEQGHHRFHGRPREQPGAWRPTGGVVFASDGGVGQRGKGWVVPLSRTAFWPAWPLLAQTPMCHGHIGVKGVSLPLAAGGIFDEEPL